MTLRGVWMRDVWMRDVWVAHSPYPGKAWRGLEKCVSGFFETKEECEAFISGRKNDHLTAVRLRLHTPDVRQDLAEWDASLGEGV